MKKLMMILAGTALMVTSAPAFAGNDRPIAVGELPATAQQFIKAHFAGVEVSLSKVDEELFDKDYKVVFVNGAKVEFTKNGEWKDVECKYGEVPAAIVPQHIRRLCRQELSRPQDHGNRPRPPRLRSRTGQRPRPEIRPEVPSDRHRQLI